MKQNVHLMIAAIVSTAAFVSCIKENVETNTTESIEVTLMTGETATKTELVGSSVYWNSEDAIGVTEGSSLNAQFDENSIAEGDTAPTASFSGTVPSAGKYYAYYPYSQLGVTSKGVAISIPSIQNPSAVSFDGKSDVMVSKPFDVSSENPVVSDLVFTRLTSIIKLVIKDETKKSIFSNEKVYSASVTSSAHLAGDARIVLSDAKLSSIYENASYTVTARYSGGIDLSENAVYLNVYPQILVSGTSIKVKLETSSYSIEKSVSLPKTLTLAPGKIGVITVTVTNTELKTPKTISFADKTVGDLCLENWDTNSDGKLSYGEAAAVTNLATVFKSNTTITTFNELKYFTGLNSIGVQAFQGCTSLTEVTLPETITAIGDAAFNGCTALKKIEIPEGVTSIGKYALYNCSGLTVIVCKNPKPTPLASKMFDGSTCKIYIPIESISDYTLSWSTYRLRIIDMNSPILFADSVVEELICDYSGWNTGGSTFTYNEAAKVTNLGSFFQSRTNITSFDELQYFTGLTLIQAEAFKGCKNLKSVTLPKSVKTIRYDAFSGCTSLTRINFPESLTSIEENAFKNCYKLESVTLPNSLTSIGENAFNNCSSTSFTSINIPESVSNIGNSAFSDCYYLKNITLPNNLTKIPAGMFFNCNSFACIILPESLTSIGNNAFNNCNSLTSITIPGSVTSIGEDAFKLCSSLGTIIIPESVSSLGESVFYGCSSLVSITIPESITSISAYAFANCSKLKSIVLPSSLISIGAHAFGSCKVLSSISIPESVSSIGESAFSGCSSLASMTIPKAVTSLENSTFSGCSSLTNITFPKTVTCFGNRVFYGCTSLASITLPESLASMGDYVFYGCTSLASITLPTSLTSMGDYVFYGCTSLASITLPTSLTSIGQYGFYGCSSLASIHLPESVSSIGSYAFYNCNSLDGITVPGVTSLGDYAFSKCTSLANITLPKVSSLGAHVFDGCSDLDNISLLMVKSVGHYSFNNCTSLVNITLPNTVTSIGNSVFKGCGSLAQISCLSPTPPSIGSSPFPTTCVILVPEDSLIDYQIEWSKYESQIMPL